MSTIKHVSALDSLILTIRGNKVLLDLDLAKIYGTSTMRLNEQVKRNASRFPKDFIFQLNLKEKKEVIANCDNLARLKFSPKLPWAFTEHGAIMAAMILNSPQAVAMSVYVVRAFLQIRERIIANEIIFKRLAEIDKTLLEHDYTLREIWNKLQPLLAPPPEPPQRKIGFNRENE